MKITPVKKIEVKAKKESWLTKDIEILPFKVSDKLKENFYSQLGLLLSSGFDLRSALELLRDDADKKWKRVLEKIYNGVVSGNLLSEELAKDSQFSPYEFESLKIGEESGKSEDIFQELAKYYQDKIALKRKILSVILYPLVVIFVGFGVVFFMLRVVVPMFEDMFKRFDSELPPVTKAVITISNGFSAALPWLILSVLIVLVLNKVLKSNSKYQFLKERFLFSIPVVGSFTKKSIQSHFSQNMRLLLSASTPLVKALELTGNMLGNEHYKNALTETIEKVSVGQSLHSALEQTNLFQKRVVSLVKVGEEVNQLDKMFEKISEQMSNELDHQSKQLGSLVEPVIIVTLGLIVGFILIAMYLPILNLSKVIG